MTVRRVGCVAAWVAMLAWMAVIFWFSAQTASESSALSGGLIQQVAQVVTPGFEELPAEEQTAVVESWQTVVRKAGHMAEYAVLGVLSWITMSFHIPPPWRRAGVAAGIGLFYAITDEVHQFFVPGRGPGVLDVGIDFVGVCLGIALAAIVTHWRKKMRGVR